MVSSKQVLVAIAAAASSAYAATCGSSDTTSIQNQGDVTSSFGTCTKWTGDVTVNPQSGATLSFPTTLKQITGTLSVENDNLLATFNLGTLTDIGELTLSNLTALATLDLSALKNVGAMNLINLAALHTFQFGSLTKTGVVTIENVQIADLNGISTASQLGSLIVSNCQFLSMISSNVSDIGVVDIGPNNVAQGQTISFTSLKTATSLTFRNSTSVLTPMLRNVSETLGLYGNKFTTYSAPNLTSVGALVLEDNSLVKNFSFPNLVSINSDNSTLDIENNTMLTSVMGFPKLATISGGLVLAGNIVNVSLPAIKTIGGAVIVDSTSSDLDCDSINNLGNGVVGGAVTCKAADPTPTGSAGTTETGSSGNSGSGGKSAAPRELPSFLTAGAFAALLAFLA